MLTVACVLRSGGIYDATWVARLRAGVARHLPLPHRFVCLSDMDVPCERIPLEHGWPGWWSKIELFKLGGPLLFFDLDTLIVGDLSDIAAQAEEWVFTVLRDFYRPEGLQSAAMAWNCEMGRLYHGFCESPEYLMQAIDEPGDQAFIEAAVNLNGVRRWQDVVPGQFVSYKADRCEAGPPPGARVVCLHGWPKFTDMPATNWCRRAWEALAPERAAA